MLEIKAAREIRGTVEMPPSLDQYIVSSVAALLSQRKTTISPVPRCPALQEWNRVIAPQCTLEQHGDTTIINPPGETAERVIALPDYHIPFRDFVIFSLLGTGKTLQLQSVPERRIEYWSECATLFGCRLDIFSDGQTTSLSLSETGNFTQSFADISFDNLYPFIGLAFALKKKIDAGIPFQFTSILRPLLAAFGYECRVSSNLPPAKRDSLKRRIRMLKKKKRSDGQILSTVAIDFSAAPGSDVSIRTGGDELLSALFLVAKSIVQKGSFMLDNVSLATGTVPLLDLQKKMGARPGIQETGQSSFGPVGMVQFQNFDLVNRKIICRPFCHYADQVPAMVVAAAFAAGQSIFRELEDMRRDAPDGIEQINNCLRLLGARLGEMPDGIVVDGAGQFDGFDLDSEISPAVNAAFAVAGLKCMGTTTVADTAIQKRWPRFNEMLQSVCQFRK
ncbi:MAG: hypothetical protein GF350_14990 [Chitinivibrionales bacterium]|nr:hypothetical protein [Chitinivibrionales bacterium]